MASHELLNTTREDLQKLLMNITGHEGEFKVLAASLFKEISSKFFTSMSISAFKKFFTPERFLLVNDSSSLTIWAATIVRHLTDSFPEKLNELSDITAAFSIIISENHRLEGAPGSLSPKSVCDDIKSKTGILILREPAAQEPPTAVPTQTSEAIELARATAPVTPTTTTPALTDYAKSLLRKNETARH